MHFFRAALAASLAILSTVINAAPLAVSSRSLSRPLYARDGPACPLRDAPRRKRTSSGASGTGMKRRSETLVEAISDTLFIVTGDERKKAILSKKPIYKHWANQVGGLGDEYGPFSEENGFSIRLTTADGIENARQELMNCDGVSEPAVFQVQFKEGFGLSETEKGEIEYVGQEGSKPFEQAKTKWSKGHLV